MIFITLQKFEEYNDILLINKNIFLDIITTLMLAAENGKLRVVTYFIENGIDINAKYGYDYYKKIGEAADYLGLGYSIFGKYKGMTILMIASKKGHMETVKYLINKGADVNIESADGLTALEFVRNERGYEYGKIREILSKEWLNKNYSNEEENNDYII